MQVHEKLKNETAREYAFRTIKDNIISLELAPGSLVSENELAAQMGISRTPVREALIELSKLKIVGIYPQKGSYISLIDGEMVDEARFLRLTLEGAIVQLACEMATEEDILSLEENIRLQEFYLQSLANEKLLELDNDLHKLLFEICNKKVTYNLLGGIMIHFDRARSLSLAVLKDSKIYSDHKDLVDAIKKRDSKQAQNVIERHLNRYKIDEKELKKEYPHYFVE